MTISTTMFNWLRATMLAAAVLFAPLSHAAAAKPAPAPASTSASEAQIIKDLFGAMQTKDYQKFIGLGNENFAKLEQPQFDAVAQQLGPRLQTGYQATRLASYQQQGYEFTLWKISFKDNGDDIIATLNVTRNGKVGGFVLR